MRIVYLAIAAMLLIPATTQPIGSAEVAADPSAHRRLDREAEPSPNPSGILPTKESSTTEPMPPAKIGLDTKHKWIATVCGVGTLLIVMAIAASLYFCILPRYEKWKYPLTCGLRPRKDQLPSSSV